MVNDMTIKDLEPDLSTLTDSIKKLSKTLKPRQIAKELNVTANTVRVIRSQLKKRNELPDPDPSLDQDPTEPDENEITGEAAIAFFNKLKNPPKNKKRDKMVQNALNIFPNPDQPQEIEIDLPDDL